MLEKKYLRLFKYCILFLYCFCSVKICIPCPQVFNKSLTSDTIIKVQANPSLGFNYPYYLRIPKVYEYNELKYLMVESNNTGVNDTLDFHERETLLEMTSYSVSGYVSNQLNVPFLMPVFPRPEKQWKIYTHAFDRDAAILKKGDMKRLDLQLIAMIEDAKKILRAKNMLLHEKILLSGFSSSGTFANRFALIHPELVEAVAYGGISGRLILPISKLQTKKLKYPVGVSDFKRLFGKAFNLKEFQRVEHFIYMGKNDTNDAVLFNDGCSKSERKIIFKHIGEKMLPDRFSKCEKIYKDYNIKSQFITYENMKHELKKDVLDDLVVYFGRVILYNNSRLREQ